jgi:hypothetical protein
MTGATKQKPEQTPAEGLRISEVPGVVVELEAHRWRPDQQAANFHFTIMLGVLCGRLEESTGGCWSERGSTDTWLTLQQVDPAAIEVVLTRMRRRYPEWKLDAGRAETLIDSIDVHFATARARARQQERL